MGEKLKRGATEGAGNTQPEERICLWRKASKSIGFVYGSWLRPVSRRGRNDKGVELLPMREGGYRQGEAPGQS
jgi:hypothetical protein